MKITLAKIKIHADMSQETTCFSASICLDGKEVGTVTNAGHGGSHQYYWMNREAGKRIVEWANSQETEFDFEKLDEIIDDLLTRQEEQKQLKRWCKTQTVFRLKGDQAGSWRTIKSPFSQKVKDYLVKTHGDNVERIANEEV